MSEPTINLNARDVSGQRLARVSGPVDAPVEDVIASCMDRMKLPTNDAENRPITYTAFRAANGAGKGEHLNATAIVGDVLSDEDTVVLHPDISAGSRTAT